MVSVFMVCILYMGVALRYVGVALCGCVLQVELVSDGPPRRLRVEYQHTETGEVSSEEFNTVGHMIVT